MFKIRKDEQGYARLNDPVCEKTNRYGDSIQLGPDAGASLNINGDSGIGDNPNRNKQHGFHFTADNCIGCHACEAACSEKNDLPPHLAFRSVGYIEGGTWPNYSRVNISMACNHCDDPVCLKGCPTRAYTKHPEYGAVIQDPDICFGCGYCTWVCPYNAPQLDPVAGHVQKCNMCVDRLEVGLKPACVTACLGNALNFGVIENTPQDRTHCDTKIPGFPDPEITHPNIRFQQTKSLPKAFTRPDSEPITYQGGNQGGKDYQPVVDLDKEEDVPRWNLKALSSRENPLVIFTLCTQAMVGAFAIPFLFMLFGTIQTPVFYVPYLLGVLSLQAFVLWLSTQHLGRPLRFYRGFNNLRYSPLSREALGIALFFAFAGGHMVAMAFVDGWLTFVLISPNLAQTVAHGFGILAVTCGLVGLYFMHDIYRIKARPFWNHWQVLSSFFGTMFALGALFATFILPFNLVLLFLVFGLTLEGIGLVFHARDLKQMGGEGSASHHKQTTQFGLTYQLRNVMLFLSLASTIIVFFLAPDFLTNPFFIGAITLIVFITAMLGRTMFYVLVIPTTMPGAFFWKNKGFEDHARQTGLADMPQCGVAKYDHP